jgi:NAD(P)-dependent dehydrogenase (short-subunit alcohol dehydrogenase family)
MNAKAVLVTGASTGIGRRITERLAKRGCRVYAGARKKQDIEALQGIANVQPIALDVTKSTDIESARSIIQCSPYGLYGLVNNAGVCAMAPVSSMPMREFDAIMDANVYGPWRMTQAFAPLIKSTRGRITTIGSINGIAIHPQYGAYGMSKHAIEAFTDALAKEMVPFGVSVSVIEPGSYKTDLVKNEVQRAGTGAVYLDYVARLKDPDEVAIAVEQALFDPNPKRRYLVTPTEEETRFAIEGQLQRLVELNERTDYSYDGETLRNMLDAALMRAERRAQEQK